MSPEPQDPDHGAPEVLALERIDRDELLSALRRTRLLGFDGARPYADARLEIVPAVDPDLLAPAQRYVLAPGVRLILQLRTALLAQGVDVFALDGGVRVRTSWAPDELVPVLPPIVEESREPDGRTVLIINDGIHRVFAARSLGLPITVVTAHGVSPEHPYYACALPDGWAGVSELEHLPDGFQKKTYRNPDGYKALFRDFNAIFPGVQKERKKSNPEHLRA
jgi:hypothetical protein